MFTQGKNKKQVCKHHHLVVKSWKKDPQAESEQRGRRDLDSTSNQSTHTPHHKSGRYSRTYSDCSR
eukprot:COSAG02_NODE_37446_length_441_cov_23.184211_1_plen_66_part_00